MSFTNLKKAQQPWWEYEYPLRLTEVNFLQIFKGQNLIIVLVLVIFYCFEATCLIIFLYQYIYQFYQSVDSFFVGMTKIIKQQYFLLELLYLSSNNSFCTDSVYLETQSVFTKTTRFLWNLVPYNYTFF